MNALRMLVALAIPTAMLVAFFARLGEPGLEIAMPVAFLAGIRGGAEQSRPRPGIAPSRGLV